MAEGKSNNHKNEQIVSALLDSLVSVLVRFGVTQGQLIALTRTALVHNAARVSRLKNGRVNQSQVAAATGLSRLEVRNHLATLPRQQSYISAPAPTTLRVVQGWRRDNRFRNSKGRPRTLKFTGPNSFTTLVRRYGADVPPRAMAIELQRQGRIVVDRDIVSLRARRRESTRQRIENVEREVAAIRTMLSVIGAPSDSNLKAYLRFVDIPAHDLTEQNMLRERAQSLMASAIEGVESLRRSPLSKPIGDSNTEHRVTVTLLVSDSSTSKSQNSNML